MSKLLGIDYGRKKIGLAIATETLAEPYGVIRYETIDEALAKLKKIVTQEKIGKIVMGVSEGKMARETKDFAKRLKQNLKKEIFFQDETLSTFEVNELVRNLKMNKNKIKKFEDAFAAAIILQNYLNLKERT